MTISTHTLKRTGDRPLQFEGEIVEGVDTHIVRGKDFNRWHEITLFREKSGRFFLEIEYLTQWQGELNHHQVEEFLNEEALAEFLKHEYDPCGHLVGYPVGEQFAGKQARVVRDLTARYQNAVSELLESLPEKIGLTG